MKKFIYKHYFCIFVNILFIIIAGIYINKAGFFIHTDGLAYLDNSRLLASGNIKGLNSYWSIFYTILLVPFNYFKGNIFFNVRLLSIILGILWINTIYIILRKIIISKELINFGIILALVYIINAENILLITPDVLLSIGAIISTWLVINSFYNKNIKYIFLSGAFGGLTCLFKGYELPYIISVLVFLSIFRIRELKIYKIIGIIIYFSLGLSIILIPKIFFTGKDSTFKYNYYYLIEHRQNPNDWIEKYIIPEKPYSHFWSNPSKFSEKLKISFNYNKLINAIKENIYFYSFWILKNITIFGTILLCLIIVYHKNIQVKEPVILMIAAGFIWHSGYLLLNFLDRYFFPSIGIFIVPMFYLIEQILFFVKKNNFNFIIKRYLVNFIKIFCLAIIIFTIFMNSIPSIHKTIDFQKLKIAENIYNNLSFVPNEFNKIIVSNDALFSFYVAYVTKNISFNKVNVSDINKYKFDYYLLLSKYNLNIKGLDKLVSKKTNNINIILFKNKE